MTPDSFFRSCFALYPFPALSRDFFCFSKQTACIAYAGYDKMVSGKKRFEVRIKTVFVVLIAAVVLLAAAAGIYVNDYYRAENVAACMAGGDGVIVRTVPEGYFFDGPGTEDALVFYPGGKVEETAYAPLLESLAVRGVDCVLIRMPAKLAIFGVDRADAVPDAYDYERYYLAGHSLGGAMAANHAAVCPARWAGLFLLAAYPTEDLTAAPFPVVFLYGENDGVLDREKLAKGRALAPANSRSVEIPGGNHAGFGAYGPQKGDGKAGIPAEAQWQITAETILETIVEGR